MDIETGSTNTSLDDKTEDFCENPTRDTLAEGLMCLLKPTIDQLDERVKFTRISQLELKQQIEGLAEELKNISDEQTWPLALEEYTNKLTNARQKITVVSNILQAAQERLQKVQAQITRETANRRSLLESYPPTTPLEASGTQSNQSSDSLLVEMKLVTPDWKLEGVEDEVYEPSEDTFLLMDVLESDLDWLKKRKPSVVVEIGCGSGVVVTALSNALANSCYCIATDINGSACRTAYKTAELNNAKVEVLETDLIKGLRNGLVDVLIFNPPYVITEPEEIFGKGIERAWAGGLKGRQVMDRLFPLLPSLLSSESCFYLVVIDENCPEEIISVMSNLGFEGNIVTSRRVRGEHLSVVKFIRTC